MGGGECFEVTASNWQHFLETAERAKKKRAEDAEGWVMRVSEVECAKHRSAMGYGCCFEIISFCEIFNSKTELTDQRVQNIFFGEDVCPPLRMERHAAFLEYKEQQSSRIREDKFGLCN